MSWPQNPDAFAIGPDERWPFYGDDEIAEVERVLRSGKVNQWTGPEVFQFERACEERLGGGHGIALANGSVALELALKAFSVGPGDDVIVSPRSFVASAFCVRLVGANPIFADVDPDSGNMTADAISAVLTPRTRAIIVVHLAGWPAEVEPIVKLAANRGVKVIEDCAQAHGAALEGASVGSFGDAATYSFCQDKIISTAGEGGYVAFRSSEAFEWAWSFKDHGKNRSKMFDRSDDAGSFRWVHDSVGTNWRMTGLQAAVGLAQLRKLEGWSAIRTRNARIWTDALSDVPGLRVPTVRPGAKHAFYKFYFYLDRPAQEAAALRREIFRRSAALGLRVFSGSCSEIYREAAFEDLPVTTLPNAHLLGETSLMVEVHPTLDRDRLEQRAASLAVIVRDLLS